MMTDQPEDNSLERLSILPLRNTVLFPQVVVPLAVGRPKSVKLIEDAVQTERPIAILTQRDPETDKPGEADLYQTGCLARILKVVKIASDNYSVIIQGQSRIRVKSIIQETPFFVGEFELLEEPSTTEEERVEIDALFMNLKQTAKQVVKFIPEMPKEASQMVDGVNDPGQLCDFVAANMDIETKEKQSILDTVPLKARLTKVVTLLARQLEVLRVSDKIQSQIKEEIDKNQKEYYLRQQLKAIKEQLGEIDGDSNDLDDLADTIEEVKLPDEVREMCRKQMKRLRMMQPASSEYGVTRTYLEVVLEIPWLKSTEDKLDILKAREILEEDHYGLEQVKKRIIEYLAVRKLKSDMSGPILCLAGPPGVGKTSLGRSIARALGRKFIRISLGGVHDESEIRGHRRTYVGALPGRIVQGLRKADSNNPVFMLDEIDKIGKDFRGDPSAALLEVLDPEQNNSFSDHYVEMPVDLSNVLFVATANQLGSISGPLRDRMDIIEIPGYTANDKLHIAKKYLLPKQIANHGITDENITFSDESLDKIIRLHTREAGVRSLERRLADVCRGVAVKVAESLDGDGEKIHITIDSDALDTYLGPERYSYDMAQRTAQPGVATGLAWTASGGDILFIEATLMFGKGELKLTGQLGDVMKESVIAALSYIKSHIDEFNISKETFQNNDIHLHVPAGGIPKDGPSAGITMFIALLSLLTGVRVRSDVAMSGEITLQGNVLPVGGVKEKVLAAHRSGIKRIILPARVRKDLLDVKEEIKDELEFFFVEHVSEIPALVLEEPELIKAKIEPVETNV